jgi:hypothetical protein
MVATMTVHVLWNDGKKTSGKTATDVLNQLLGGWNPTDIDSLRYVLANRAGIAYKKSDEDDLQFLYRLDEASILCVQIDEEDLTDR